MEQTQQQQDTSLHFLDYWRVIRSRKEVILAVTLLVVLTGTAYTFTLPRIYRAQTLILVRDDALDVDVFERQFANPYNPYYLRTQFEIIQSRPILLQVIDSLNLIDRWSQPKSGEEGGEKISREDALVRLQRSLRVEQARDTSLIAIKVFREDPREAAEIANEIARVYRDQRLKAKRDELRRGLEAMQEELEKQREIVQAAEQKLERLRKELGVALLTRGQRADKIRLQQLEADRIAARVDMLSRKARLEQLEGLSGEELVDAAAYIVNDPEIAAIRRQLVDFDVQLRLLLENLGENHPDVRRLRAGREELAKKMERALAGLQRGLRAEYEVSLARYEALENELEKARAADIAAEGDRFLPFDRAERELELQRTILEALEARFRQENIKLDIPRTQVEIVEPAEPPPANRPVSPNFLLNIVLSVVIGLTAGVGLAYFIEYLDTSVKTVDDVERYLGVPVIGVIPQKVRPLIEEGPDSPYAEAYRMLRTNLIFANKGATGGAFTVTSGGSGEGKSTTLFNLAYVCATIGDKVLIVDSDLRRPVQHTILGMPNRFGLTNVLMRDVPIEAIKPVASVPNLHFLPSGKLPRSSVGVLNPQRVRELIRNLKTRYDYIFFDSPPLVGVSDASILASETDGVLLVVQYRKYPRVISLRAKRMIENVGGKIIGVVLNNINVMRDDYYYYYHSYYSSYYYRPEEGRALPAGRESGTVS
jgi:capsular exopolysaccharide synthesis family protein